MEIATMSDTLRQRVVEAEAVADDTPVPGLPGELTENLDPAVPYGRGFEGQFPNSLDPGKVTRAKLLERGGDLSPDSSSSDLTEFLWMVNAWGYGKSGYGPARTRKVLEAAGPEFETSARAALVILHGPDRENPAVDAYYHLHNEGHVGDGGPAFFTKFLTFADPANQPEAKHRRRPALILDQWIATGVNHYLPESYKGRHVSRRQPLGRYGQWSWTTPQYAYFLALVERLCVSAQFSREPYRGRPLAIERALFHYFRDGEGRNG